MNYTHRSDISYVDIIDQRQKRLKRRDAINGDSAADGPGNPSMGAIPKLSMDIIAPPRSPVMSYNQEEDFEQYGDDVIMENPTRVLSQRFIKNSDKNNVIGIFCVPRALIIYSVRY